MYEPSAETESTGSYFEVGVYQPRREHNVGTLWRTALQVGANAVFTVGRQYRYQTSDVFKTTQNLPLKHYLSVEELLQNRPADTKLIAVEMGGISLRQFQHPARAVYLLGAEDVGLPQFVLQKADIVLSLDAATKASYNLAVAGSIVMYHRQFLG